MYAGFWKRFLASLIDYIIIFCIQILFLIVWAGFELLLNLIGIEQRTKEIILGVLGTPIMLALGYTIQCLSHQIGKRHLGKGY